LVCSPCVALKVMPTPFPSPSAAPTTWHWHHGPNPSSTGRSSPALEPSEQQTLLLCQLENSLHPKTLLGNCS
uniref:Uncharacterized protein n=1 Tax=Hippocampus comes TaxID=109280 RepID=A0A3Q2YBI8_HIPCM